VRLLTLHRLPLIPILRRGVGDSYSYTVRPTLPIHPMQGYGATVFLQLFPTSGFRFPGGAGGEQPSVATPTGRKRMGSPTLQTLQEPILLTPWLSFRRGGFPNPEGTCKTSYGADA
jgi:hypothetical protein